MFDDPSVSFFAVNAGGHTPVSAVQNPAWDFEWSIEDYPLNQSVGFNGLLIYAPFAGEDEIFRRYQQWIVQNRD